MLASREWRTVLHFLESNPTAPSLDGEGEDPRAFFTVDDGNLLSATGQPNVSGLSAAVAALRKQKGIDGNPLNLSARRLVVPADYEITARQVLKDAELRDMTVISTPEIQGAYYVMSDPGRYASLGLGYLAPPGGRLQTWSIERVSRLPSTFADGAGYHVHQTMQPMLISRRGIVRCPIE